jgi:hypothetical protein
VIDPQPASHASICTLVVSHVCLAPGFDDLLALAAGVGLPMACSCCMCAPVSQRAGWYDSFMAYSLANFMGRYEDTVAPLKAALFQLLMGGGPKGSSGTGAAAAAATGEGQGGSQGRPLSILEIGIGTGELYCPCTLLHTDVLCGQQGLMA